MVVWEINQASMSNWEIALPLFNLGKTLLPSHMLAQAIILLHNQSTASETGNLFRTPTLAFPIASLREPSELFYTRSFLYQTHPTEDHFGGANWESIRGEQNIIEEDTLCKNRGSTILEVYGYCTQESMSNY
jgi:hypothetical protein